MPSIFTFSIITIQDLNDSTFGKRAGLTLFKHFLVYCRPESKAKRIGTIMGM